MTKTNRLALICALLCSAAALVATESSASATTTTTNAATPPTPTESAGATTTFARPAHLHLLVADNVVVTPQGNQAAPAPQPTTQVEAVPVQSAPAAPAPTYVEPSSRHVVHTDVSPPHSYMSTIAVSALMGAVAGGLVGGAIYFLGDRNHAENIGYWAAGGVLVGTGVGIVEIIVQQNTASEATALNKLPSDPAPTHRLALATLRF